MKCGKQRIFDLPLNEVTSLADIARQFEREAALRGEARPGAVRLQIGEPSFRTPEHICQAAIAAIEREPLTYGPADGWPWLRERLAQKIEQVNGYSVGPQHCGIAPGGSGALLTAMLATIGAGDEALLPDPHWPLHYMQVITTGATPVLYPLDEQNEWLPEVARLEQLVTARTRLLLINSPGNPTGAVFPAALMAELLDFARRHDLYLLSDECYDEMIFEGAHVSPASLLSRAEFESGGVICVYTFSKTYAMTGWRIGYVVTGSQLMKTITDVLNASYTNVTTIAQRAALAALDGPQDCVGEMRLTYQRRRDLAVKLLKHFDRYVYTPHGAFYALVNIASRKGEERQARQFALDLLRERNVAVASGNTFGEVAKEYVRISLAAPDEEIERGVREICLFADR